MSQSSQANRRQPARRGGTCKTLPLRIFITSLKGPQLFSASKHKKLTSSTPPIPQLLPQLETAAPGSVPAPVAFLVRIAAVRPRCQLAIGKEDLFQLPGEALLRRAGFARFLNVPRHPFHNQVFEFSIDPLLPSLWSVRVRANVAVWQLPG